MLLTQAYFINRVDRTAREQVASYAAITSAQIEENFNNIFRSISYSAVYLAENSMTKKYLSVNDPLETYCGPAIFGSAVPDRGLPGTLSSSTPFWWTTPESRSICTTTTTAPLMPLRKAAGWKEAMERARNFPGKHPNQTFPVCVVPVHSGTNVQIGSILIPMNLAEPPVPFRISTARARWNYIFWGRTTWSSPPTQMPSCRNPRRRYTYIEHQLQNSAFRWCAASMMRRVAEDFYIFPNPAACSPQE